jgi:hypothetical protein
MRGAGWIYRAFSDGTLDRDDEVALRHGPAGDGYPALSEAMVNIRRTLQAAQDQEIISDVTRGILTVTGAALFYHDRNWPGLLKAGQAAGADAAELGALRRWLPAGRIDQQADDARAMLREMRRFLAAGPAPQQVSWNMANTTRWEAVKRRAGTMNGDGPAGSEPTLEGVLDEVRLLGPGAFEAARSRSLLRLFAGAFAERQGVMVDGERLADAVAAFRLSSGLEQGTEFGQFLAANELTAGDVERLIAADELAHWACEQAGRDVPGDILNELRMRGEYARLATRARGKLGQPPRGGQEPEPADGARGEPAAVRWYFAERCGTAVPEDLAGHAQASGFPDEQAFRRAVRREYQYVREVTATGAGERRA